MTTPDSRKSGRSSVFLIVNFRASKKSKEYLLGISNNFSSKGISIESQNSGYGPGEVLELVLKHPHSDMSASVTGRITWKNDGWYKSVMGIEYIDMDHETESRISGLISSVMEALSGSMLPEEYTAGPAAAEKGAADVPAQENKKEGPIPDTARPGQERISDKEYLVSAVSELNRSADKETGKPMKRERALTQAQKTDRLLKTVPHAGTDRAVARPASGKRPGSKFWPAAAVLAILLAASASVLFIKDARETLLTYIPEARSILPADTYSADKYIKKHFPVGSPEFNAAEARGSVEMPQQADGPESADAIPAAEDTDIIAGPQVAPGNIQAPEVEEKPAVTAYVQDEGPAPDKEETGDADISAKITFGTNSVRIDPSFYPEIDKVTGALSSDPKAFIRLESHTDNVGPGIYNIDLSMRRALAVQKLLAKKGILNNKIKIILFGDSSPIAENDTEYGRRRNRRVEIRVVHSAD